MRDDFAALAIEVDEYLKGSLTFTMDGDSFNTMVIAPIEVGPGSFMSVSDVPFENMPKLPEQKMDFAMRYATEYRQLIEWAEEFKVHINTVSSWLRDPQVQKYIAMMRYERRVYNMGQMLRLERKVFEEFYKLIAQPWTKDNMVVKAAMLKFYMERGSEHGPDAHQQPFRGMGAAVETAKKSIAATIDESKTRRDMVSSDDETLKRIDAEIAESESVLRNIQAVEDMEKGDVVDADFSTTPPDGSGLPHTQPSGAETKES